ncbi:MAG: putative cobaltochelatase [Chloroflexota bacterium]|nr:putative cobaltochelatase [Chloroflexota bacterium]
MNERTRLVFPFSAIVGQDAMKKALLLNAINPKIGGVLIRGEKGTAKSIAVRALAQLLPRIEVVANCHFLCDPRLEESLCDSCIKEMAEGGKLAITIKRVPVVDLPIGATEDRVVGTLDIEAAIKTGEKNFEPGLLAAANRGILYIDEVNLLDDHLVDILLDAAAMGVNSVEREGISFSHPAQFILVGTMNPEEGELRPQLLDRFGLAVEVKGIPEQEARAEVVRRRFTFERDPVYFAAAWESEQDKLRKQISQAKKLLPEVHLDDEMLKLITQICVDFAVDGHRADIVMHKTAITIAAFHGRTTVNEHDISEAAELSLLHRRRRQPFEDAQFDSKQLQKSIVKWKETQEREETQATEEGDAEEASDDGNHHDAPRGSPDEGIVFEAESPYSVKAITTPLLDQLYRNETGRRSKSISSSKTGRYVRSEIPKDKVSDLAFDATLRAASPYQSKRKAETSNGVVLHIKKHDLRQKVRERKAGNLIMFILDGSGSMIAEERMVATKGAILSMLLDAYQRRDHVGLIIFRDSGAQLVLPPTNSVDLAQKCLRKLPAGGRTPLTHGLKLGLNVTNDYLRRKPKTIPLIVLVSDGKGNVHFNGGSPIEEAKSVAREIRTAYIHSIAIDTEEKDRIQGLMEDLSQEMGGLYLLPEELKADQLAIAVKERINHWR